MRNLNCKTFDIDIGNGEKLTGAFMIAKYVDNKFPFLGIVLKKMIPLISMDTGH